MLIKNINKVDFELDDLPKMDLPGRVLMTDPAHFDVQYVINPHMKGKEGTVNPDVAREQWETLRETYADLGFDVHVMEGERDLPDMVFCANQTLPTIDDKGEKQVVLSKMHAEERRQEVPFYERFFGRQGYSICELPSSLDGSFEGMGDALWHAGRRLIWGGHGFRTDLEAYEHISELLDVPVVILALADEDFYHLDTCLSILNERSALAHLNAFDENGRALINHFFDTVIDTPDDEARRLFACNAHSPDGEHVIIQKGCTTTNSRLKEAGFTPVELDTSEFLKSGGSVFCMKMMFW